MRWPALLLLVFASPLLAYPDRLDESLWREARLILREVELENEEEAARKFLAEYDSDCQKFDYLTALTNFNYETNVTKANADERSRINLLESKWDDRMLARARQFDPSKMGGDMRRMFELITRSTLPKSIEVRKKLQEYGNKLIDIYSSAEVCLGSKCYGGETDLVALYANLSTGYDTLLSAWKGWRDATGPKMKPTYVRMVDGLNIGATDNGYEDLSEPWKLLEMDDPNLDVTALNIWQRVKPLYDQLHAYVRYHLGKRYPGKVDPDGPIPEHLLGNVWGQEWGHVYPLMEPFPNVPSPDITAAMKRQNYDVKRIFTTAESFFVSLGLPKMTRKFWENSLFVEPSDGMTVQCHASAEDLDAPEKDDFRIKMCTAITEFDLMTAHHEMGHVEYYMMYRNQPCVYRTGANTAFHEAVGDTMQLSVMTPQHLYKLGLASEEDVGGSKETRYKRGVNFLLRMALNKVGFLPYGLLLDNWRWRVFRGQITPDNYNHNWWKLRIGWGGVMPPIDRSEKDFDPASKYHIASNTRYIRYFFSFLLQFQFHRSLCQIAGHEGPIHECDIHGSKLAGEALGDMLSLGKSRPWPDALETLTGEREVNPDAILEYFKPLHEWLIEENRRNGVKIGWKTENIGVTW